MDKPLPNKCQLHFECAPGECVYWDGCSPCSYYDEDSDVCNSFVARVNACVIYIKNSGISKEELHRMVEAINDD